MPTLKHPYVSRAIPVAIPRTSTVGKYNAGILSFISENRSGATVNVGDFLFGASGREPKAKEC